MYGFYEEIYIKYGNVNEWNYFKDLFDYLTIVTLIEGIIFCVHCRLSLHIEIVD